MKSLNQLNNNERAKLLAQLFPESVAVMVQTIEATCDALLDDIEKHRKEWTNGFISFDWWVHNAKELKRAIEENKKTINKPNVFADQLFDGTLSIFSANVLLGNLPDTTETAKLGLAIPLFFN